MRNVWFLAALLTASLFGMSGKAAAFDLVGAWATSVDQCSKVFVRQSRANQIGFTSFPGVYGGGFIAAPGRLRGRSENCSITSRKDDGQSINMLVSCASGIMYSKVQFILKIVDDDAVTRMFPGMEEMEVTYHRCKL